MTASSARRRILVAIDGPGGAGKSTVARALAERLGVPRLDTGAMYRAVTLQALRDGLALDDEDGLAKLAADVELDLEHPPRVLADGKDVTEAIRTPEIDAAVSQVAATPGVRRALVRRQQEWIAAHGGGVVEGRDIGTVVAPQADLKVYLTASAAERADRRAAQGRRTDRSTVDAAMRRRDRLDSTRPHSPLMKADDAVEIDSTGRSVDDVVAELLALLEQSPARAVVAGGAAVPPRPAVTAPATDADSSEEPPVGPATVRSGAGQLAGRPIRRGELWFYSACRLVVVAIGYLFWPGPVVGREHLPPRGAYILAPVHRSNIDWLVVARLTRRRLRYLAKDQVWRVRPVGRLIELLGAFPVRRTAADREAMGTALSVLAGGEPLVLFPEGTRRAGSTIGEIRDGAAYLALRADVPILPVGIAGSEAAMPRGAVLPRPRRIAIVVGEPIGASLPAEPARASSRRSSHVPRSAVRATSDALRSSLQRCLDEASALRSRRRLRSPAAPRPISET